MHESIKHVGALRVTVPVALLAGLFWLGFSADSISVDYLKQWFITRAEAQTISEKVDRLEGSVNDLGRKIDTNRVAAIEREVFDLRIQQCMAQGALKTVFADQLAKLVGEWQTLTGRQGNPPTYVDCNDLG